MMQNPLNVSAKARSAVNIGSHSIAEAAKKFVESRTNIQRESQQSQVAAQALSSQRGSATGSSANGSPANGIPVLRNYQAEFSAKLKNSYTLEAIEKELAQLSSELSESPVLYFRYHPRKQNLTLSSVAGQVQVPNYALMQAYVRKDIETQIETLANDGKVASITNYGPISKIMISNLNVAHFEAWAVTSDAEVSNGSKMVGVLVVLQAGFRSAQARPTLAKMIREAGNYIYAQNGKIRTRTNPDATLEVAKGSQANPSVRNEMNA